MNDIVLLSIHLHPEPDPHVQLLKRNATNFSCSLGGVSDLNEYERVLIHVCTDLDVVALRVCCVSLLHKHKKRLARDLVATVSLNRHGQLVTLSLSRALQ